MQVNETYAAANNPQLKQAARFLSLMYSKQYNEAFKLYGFKNAVEEKMVNFFSNSYKQGDFVRFGEATLTTGSDVYISAVHSKGIVQWILCISKDKVVGWDVKFQGNFRQPTEKGQQIKQTVPSDSQSTQLSTQPSAPPSTQPSAPPSVHTNPQPSAPPATQPTVNANWFETQNVVPKRIIRAQYEYQNEISLHNTFSKLFSSDATYKYEFLLPTNRPYQRHVGLFVDPPPAKQTVYFVQGNFYLLVEYTSQPSSIKYTVDMELDPVPLTNKKNNKYDEILNNNSAACHWNVPTDDPRIYLGVTPWTSARIDPYHPRVIQLLPSIIGTETREREKALKIAKWIANIPYEMPPPGQGWPTLDQYLSNYKYVECGGHALLFCVFARAAGIPARRIYWPGIERKDNGGMKFGSHCIAEFFDSATLTWFPVDATTGPFNEHNRDHWGRVPFKAGSEPNGLVTHVESMDGKERQVLKATNTNLVMLS